MGLRYRIPFKDVNNNSYEVQIYREDYTGEATELTGATSCFVVSGTDEDFMYHPVRTSSATLNVLDSELLLDLYSINNQYAPVKLYKNGSLEWTGYIKPEQYTQPYVQTVESISIECVSALETLEYIEYKASTEKGVITLWELLKKLISSANGGYIGVYIPNSYGQSGNIFENIKLIESNFTSEEMNSLEVLEEICKFLNWSCHDINGYIYFVDADWKGIYRLYQPSLTSYSEITLKEVTIQDIGYNGSSSNSLDIIHGFNKASVKAINNVFDEVIAKEDFEKLEPFSEITYLEDENFCKKEFVIPKEWEIITYDSNKQVIDMSNPPLNTNHDCYGAVAMKLAEYKGEIINGVVVTDVNEYPFVDAIQMRYRTDDHDIVINGEDKLPIFKLKGANAVWSEGAISINASIRIETEYRMIGLIGFSIGEKINGTLTDLKGVLRIGDYYWNGESWVKRYSTFVVPFTTKGSVKINSWVSIEDTKTPDLPYKGLSGYIVELPNTPIIGDLEFTMLSFDLDQIKLSTKYGITMKDLSFNYAKKDGILDDGEDGDRIYENVVNEKYMSEAEEIDFRISSYNADGATYSKAIINDIWLTNNFYCKIVNEEIRPEELMIRRIVNRYGETKIKLTEALCMTDEITPITRIKERSMANKSFRLTSGEWDYEQNRLIVQIQEDVE